MSRLAAGTFQQQYPTDNQNIENMAQHFFVLACANFSAFRCVIVRIAILMARLADYYVHIYIYMYRCAGTCISNEVSVLTCIARDVDTYMYVYVCMHVYMYTCTYTHVYIYIHIYSTYTYTYIWCSVDQPPPPSPPNG